MSYPFRVPSLVCLKHPHLCCGSCVQVKFRMPERLFACGSNLGYLLGIHPKVVHFEVGFLGSPGYRRGLCCSKKAKRVLMFIKLRLTSLRSKKHQPRGDLLRKTAFKICSRTSSSMLAVIWLCPIHCTVSAWHKEWLVDPRGLHCSLLHRQQIAFFRILCRMYRP